MVANAELLYSTRFATKPAIRVTMAGGTETLTLNTIATQDYYTTKLSGSNSLLLLLELALESHTDAPSITMSISTNGSEPKRTVRIVTSAASTLLWADPATTLDARLFGFAVANTGNAFLHQGTEMPGLIWSPKRPISFDSRERQPTLGGVARALSGKIYVTNYGQSFKERTVTFQRFANTYALNEAAPSGESYNTFERAWDESIALGYPFELADEDDYENGTEYRVASIRQPMSRDSTYPILWNATLPVVRTA